MKDDDFWRGYKRCLDMIMVEHRLAKEPYNDIDDEAHQLILHTIMHVYNQCRLMLPKDGKNERKT